MSVVNCKVEFIHPQYNNLKNQNLYKRFNYCFSQ